VAGSFELEETTRGRVTDEAVCDDGPPADGPADEVDLLSRTVNEGPRLELLGDDVLLGDVLGMLVLSAIGRAFPFTANELS
jgi:hypothetical protein